jgi:hypothetical protein
MPFEFFEHVRWLIIMAVIALIFFFIMIGLTVAFL